MEVQFATREIAKRLGSDKTRRKTFGDEIGHRVYRRLLELQAAPSLGAMKTLPGRCHELTGDRKGQLAVDVTKNVRLVFEPADEPCPRLDDDGLDWGGVKSVRILEVVDYHD